MESEYQLFWFLVVVAYWLLPMSHLDVKGLLEVLSGVGLARKVDAH